MFAVCAPSRRPTSSVTDGNTRAGSPALATSVATRRSAACSASSAWATTGSSEVSIAHQASHTGRCGPRSVAGSGREPIEHPRGRELRAPVGAPVERHVVARARVHREVPLDRVPVVVLADEVVEVVVAARLDVGEAALGGARAVGAALPAELPVGGGPWARRGGCGPPPSGTPGRGGAGGGARAPTGGRSHPRAPSSAGQSPP